MRRWQLGRLELSSYQSTFAVPAKKEGRHQEEGEPGETPESIETLLTPFLRMQGPVVRCNYSIKSKPSHFYFSNNENFVHMS